MDVEETVTNIGHKNLMRAVVSLMLTNARVIFVPSVIFVHCGLVRAL